MRLLYERPKHKPLQRHEGVPKRGLYTMDAIKQISRLSLDKIQVIGVDPGMVDPGMIDLINCFETTFLLESGFGELLYVGKA